MAGRIASLADRAPGVRPANAKPFTHLVPLVEVLGEVLGVGPSSRRVRKCYADLLARAGSELSILLDLPVEDARREGPPLLDEALRRMRAGQVTRRPGYDGLYGSVRVLERQGRSRRSAGFPSRRSHTRRSY